jgi:SNF2 family DNA or RNA helicase
VIHYDPWWNPAVEEQASDRAHRIGQTKSVFVYKLIAADTVEERIVALQERKAELANIAFGEDGGASPALASEDVDFLFGPAPDLLAA